MKNYRHRELKSVGLLLWFSISIAACGYIQQKMEACNEHTLVPLMEKFGNDQVILSNGVVLSAGDSYEFSGGSVSLQLLTANEDEATFLYQDLTVQGEAGTSNSSTEIYRCELTITDNDETYLHPQAEFLPKPEDFAAPDWRIDEYTEYVIPERFYLVEPGDEVNLLLDVTRSAISYRVVVDIRSYETEEIAAEALQTEQGAYFAQYETNRTQFVAQTQNYFDGCIWQGLRSCGYLGQYGTRLLIVQVSTITGNLPGTFNIPTSDWHYIVGLAEMKLLDSTKD
jgi:hypothetical protein